MDPQELTNKVTRIVQRIANKGAYTEDDVKELEGFYYQGVDWVREEVKGALGIEDTMI
jgi:hypothetical protein